MLRARYVPLYMDAIDVQGASSWVRGNMIVDTLRIERALQQLLSMSS